MEINNRQYFGVKYPFRNEGFQKFYLDANETLKDKARGEIMHVIFTPKGQRIRNPEFGTDLIRYIFEDNSGLTWEEVKGEIMESVSRFVPYATITDIEVAKDDNEPYGVYVKLGYSVAEGNKVTTDSIGVEL